MGLAASLFLTGCLHLGPRSVATDRFDYSTAIADSWKQQTLLNIVKLCYMDMPVFVDVASIVSGYSLETNLSAGVSRAETDSLGGDITSFGGSGRFTERPTITYVPMTGEKFLTGLITPIDPKNIFFMLQAGYAADFVLGLTVESLNGLRNRSASGGTWRAEEPDFVRVLELLREAQNSGVFGMRVEEDKAKGSVGIVFLRNADVPAEVEAQTAEIRRLLHLRAGQERLVLSYSPVRGAEDELSVNSRSMLQIMMAFATYVDVPEEHRLEHRTFPAANRSVLDEGHQSVRVHSGKERPKDAFVAVRYREYWFWIDDGDWQTKRALSAVMFFFTLANTGDGGKLPLITIPAQ